jgi:hypothetical protein
MSSHSPLVSRYNFFTQISVFCSLPRDHVLHFCVIYLPLTFILLMWRIGRPPNSISIYSYIQQDATSHSLFISRNCSTCFGWYFHPSSGAHTTLSTASGICHTGTAICRYRGRVGTGLSVLWVAYGTSTYWGVSCWCGSQQKLHCID